MYNLSFEINPGCASPIAFIILFLFSFLLFSYLNNKKNYSASSNGININIERFAYKEFDEFHSNITFSIQYRLNYKRREKSSVLKDIVNKNDTIDDESVDNSLIEEKHTKVITESGKITQEVNVFKDSVIEKSTGILARTDQSVDDLKVLNKML